MTKPRSLYVDLYVHFIEEGTDLGLEQNVVGSKDVYQ